MKAFDFDHRLVDSYARAASLPDAPLREFQAKTNDLPGSTQPERLLLQRIGQDIFRDRLMDYWQRRCPLTGISDPALLRASHIIPWAECESDAERLNVHNGLLLSALWDAAFDRALVTFDDEGKPEFSSGLSEQARAELETRVTPRAGVRIETCASSAGAAMPAIVTPRAGVRIETRKPRSGFVRCCVAPRAGVRIE